jgi:hypothetical protein
MNVFLAAAVAALGLLTLAGTAQAQRFDCPLSQARTEITSPLPSGWWQTPQVGSLQDTNIQNIGGDPTMMCGYWAYGKNVWVMHKVPAGTNCVADATGFTCNGGSTPPVTHKTGLLELKQTWVVDLDNGTLGGSGGGGDVWFQAKTATQRFLTPRNGAQIALAGMTSINLSGCQALGTYSSASMPIEAFPEGMYVCVKTNEGRYSQFRVNTAPGPSPGVLNLGFTTWAN